MLLLVLLLLWQSGLLRATLAAPHALVALAGCCALAGVLEAATDQIDNLFLPIFFHTCLLAAAALEPRPAGA